MKEFIDKTSEQDGTDINRENLMAMQGFVKNDIVFENGKIIETNGKGEKLTTEVSGNQIIETFVGKKTITKTTTFKMDGNISEVIS